MNEKEAEPKIVVFATGWFPPEVSGEANILKMLSEYYPADKLIYIAKKVAGSKAFDAGFGSRVYRLKLYSRNTNLAWRILRLLEICLLIRKENPDVILVGNGKNAFEISNAMKILRSHIPYVILSHGTELLHLVPNSKAVQPYLKSSCVVANSQYTKSLAKRLGIPDQLIVVLHPGCDTEIFRPGLDTTDLVEKLGVSGKKILLTVGGIVERKGQDMVIRSLEKIREAGLDVHYLVGGTGIDSGRLKKLARELLVEEHVSFLDHIADCDLPYLYNLCHIFVMPSREALETVEGFGMVFAEAAACGKPCIAGGNGGMAEAVINGETGMIVDSEDVDCIADAAIQLLKDEDMASRFGAAGRKFVEKELSWAGYFRCISNMLTSVARHSRSQY